MSLLIKDTICFDFFFFFFFFLTITDTCIRAQCPVVRSFSLNVFGVTDRKQGNSQFCFTGHRRNACGLQSSLSPIVFICVEWTFDYVLQRSGKVCKSTRSGVVCWVYSSLFLTRADRWYSYWNYDRRFMIFFFFFFFFFIIQNLYVCAQISKG